MEKASLTLHSSAYTNSSILPTTVNSGAILCPLEFTYSLVVSLGILHIFLIIALLSSLFIYTKFIFWKYTFQ